MQTWVILAKGPQSVRELALASEKITGWSSEALGQDAFGQVWHDAVLTFLEADGIDTQGYDYEILLDAPPADSGFTAKGLATDLFGQLSAATSFGLKLIDDQAGVAAEHRTAP